MTMRESESQEEAAATTQARIRRAWCRSAQEEVKRDEAVGWTGPDLVTCFHERKRQPGT